MTGFDRSAAAVALIVTPLTIVACYALFSDQSAVTLGIRDIEGDFLSGVLTALVVLVAIQVLPVPPRHRLILSTLWMLRTSVTLGLMLFYEGFYAALDARGYYQHALRLSDPLALFDFGDGTANLTALTGLMAQITHSYSAMKVLCAAVGLASVYIAYRAAVLAIGRDCEGALYLLGLMPSILFWTSILGKEPIVSFGVALLGLGAVGYLERRHVAYLLLFAIGLLIASSIRSWLLVIFMAPMIATIVLASRTPVWSKVAMALILAPLFLLSLQGFVADFQIASAQDLVVKTNELADRFSLGGSAQQLDTGFDSPGALIAFLPAGIFTALFRPLPGEVLNPFGLLAGLENAALLGMLIYGVRRRGTLPFRIEPILLWSILTLIAWATVYGFVSYYNLGTAFRYRQIVGPILVLLAAWAAFGPAWRPRVGAALRVPAPQS